MTAEEERLKNRFLDLAERAYRHGIPVFSPFLSEQERALLLSMRRTLAGVSAACFGGIPDCERQIACFRPDTERDADVPFPIVCLRIRPKSARFSEALSHRDFLGALLHLGLERDSIGDILPDADGAYIFCTEPAAALILAELQTVRCTSVTAERTDPPAQVCMPQLYEETVQVMRLRLDALVARACRLPREKAQRLFLEGRVFKNGLQANASDAGAAGDLVSVRGYGRFRILALAGESRKGKTCVRIEKSWQ